MDNSDEIDCSLFKLKDGYDPNFSSRNFGKDKAEVNVSIHIKSISEIKELSMEFEARVFITMEWYDPRITFRNLKNDEKLNAINSNEERSKLWLPSLVFQNSRSGTRTLIDNKAWLGVRRLGKYNMLFKMLIKSHNEFIVFFFIEQGCRNLMI